MMKARHVYLLLCIPGTILPLSQFLPFLTEHGIDFRRFLEQLFANPVSGFFGFDVIISFVVLVAFMLIERRRLAVNPFWAPLAASLAVGVSLGLPLFLYLRERKLDSQPDAPGR